MLATTVELLLEQGQWLLLLVVIYMHVQPFLGLQLPSLSNGHAPPVGGRVFSFMAADGGHSKTTLVQPVRTVKANIASPNLVLI